MSLGEAARKRATKAKGGNGAIVGFSLVVAAGFFSIPFIAHYTKVRSLSPGSNNYPSIQLEGAALTGPVQGANLTAQEKPLNSSQIRRGPYANSGSRDAGADPDWDLKTGTYHGRRGPSVKHATGSKHADD